MNPPPPLFDRRQFTKSALLAGATFTSGVFAADAPAKRIRVGIIGCGSASRMYFPNLKESPHVEIVSACDIIPERAKGRAEEFGVPHQYPNINAMLAGAPFDLLVNLTDMPPSLPPASRSGAGAAW